MARKKMRKFAGGGDFSASDEIIVKGKRPNTVDEISSFDLARFGGMGGMGNAGGMPFMDGGGGGGMMGGGAGSQRLAALTPPATPAKGRMAVTPAIVRQPQSALGNIIGARAPKGYGASVRMGFAKGGKAGDEPTGGKKHSKAKKYSTGGKVSSASKRGDGCATKGHTRGKIV